MQRCALEICHANAWRASRSKNAEAFLNFNFYGRFFATSILCHCGNSNGLSCACRFGFHNTFWTDRSTRDNSLCYSPCLRFRLTSPLPDYNAITIGISRNCISIFNKSDTNKIIIRIKLIDKFYCQRIIMDLVDCRGTHGLSCTAHLL